MGSIVLLKEEQACLVNFFWIHNDKTLFRLVGWKRYWSWYFTCAHCEESIAHNVILRLNSKLSAMHSSNSNVKAIYKHWGQGHMINTERGIPGFSGCYMNDRAKHCLVDACVWVCWWTVGGELCEVECESQVTGGLTSLHRQRSEALSLSRYTSSLGNAVSLQNKHTSHLVLSLKGHGRTVPGENTDQKLAANFTCDLDGCCKLQLMDVKSWRNTLCDECRVWKAYVSFSVTGDKNKKVGNIYDDYR